MGSDGAARVTLIRKIQTDLKSHFAHHKPDSKERAFQRDKRRNTGGIQFATTRKSCMDTTDKNTLTATLIIINESPSIFWRDDLTAELPHKGFPAKLPRNSQTVLKLKGSPQVPQDINIDYNIKKIVFSAQAVYTNYRPTFRLRTAFLYCWRRRLGSRAPETDFFWEHEACSVGHTEVCTHSELTGKSTVNSYPIA